MRKLISLLVILCMTSSLCIVCAEKTNPWEGWTLGSFSRVENGELHIETSAGVSDYSYGYPTVKDNFDVEFDMRVSNLYNGAETHMEIGTGRHRVYLVIGAGGMRYMSKTYQQTGFTNIPFKLDDSLNHFRVIGNSGLCELHINGKFVADLDIQTSSQTQSVFGAGHGASLMVKNYVSNTIPTAVTVDYEALMLQNSPQKAFLYEFEDEEDDSVWELGGSASIHDGFLDLSANNVLTGTTSAYRKTGYARNYIFETKMKIVDAGGADFSIDIILGDYYATIFITESGISVRNYVAMAPAEYRPVATDGEWHTFKVETYENGTWAVLSVDDEPILDWRLPESYYTTNEMGIGIPALLERPYQILVDWIRFEPKDDVSIFVDTPKENAEYLEGETVRLSANIPADEKIPYVEYKMYGQTVAKGVAPEYRAEIKDVKPGSHVITAEYGEKVSAERRFMVIPSIKADMIINEENMSVELELYDQSEKTEKVVYYVNGVKRAESSEAPYVVTISGLTDEFYTLRAECVDKNGITLCTTEKEVVPQIKDGINSKNFSNEVSYCVEGSEGTAEVEISNGRHRLYLKHTPDEVSVLTENGIKTYAASVGKYNIITDAYAADVYADGQLVFSYVMPKTDDVCKNVSEKGLRLKDFRISLPKEKRNHFVMREFKNSNNGLYAIPTVDYNYNLDFVLKNGENVKIGVADGYYNLNLEVSEGKIYATEVDYAGRVPERRYLADVPQKDEVYFRVETVLGMARLYADGSWLTTIGNPRSTSTRQIAIETDFVEGIEYIAVSDNADLFLYHEEFDEKGEIDALDYFVTSDLEVAEGDGGITLEAVGDVSGKMMTNTSAGDAEFAIETEIQKCDGGIWFVYNQSSLNTYSKAGYNFKTGEFEIINSTIDGEEKISQKGSLEVGKNVTLSLKIDREHEGKSVILSVDGAPVISDENSTISYGAIGLEIYQGKMMIESFDYRGDAKPMADMKVFDMEGQDITYNLVEWDDEWVLMNDSRRLHSTDLGASWTAEYTGRVVNNVGVLNGDSNSTITLPSGEMLSISKSYVYQGSANNPDPYDRTGHNYRVCSSQDGGKTWEEITWIFDEAFNGDVTCNRLRRGPNGRLYYGVLDNISEQEGSLIVCYSDDNGRNWTIGPEVKYSDVGIMCQEAEILPMPDGEVRIYMRNETGMLQYIVSKDNGETWDYTLHKTPLFNSASHFNIEMDAYEENTYWAVTQYNNRNDDGRVQQPRNRVALFRSTDGCQNWDYMGTIYEFDVENFIRIRGGDLHMMNINVNVTADYVVATLPIKREDQGGYVNRIVTLRKDKLKPLAKPEILHVRPGRVDAAEPVSDKKISRTMVIAPNGTSVLLAGVVVYDAAQNGALYLEVLEAFLGWKVESIANNSATFVCGDASVTCGVKKQDDGRYLVDMNEVINLFQLKRTAVDGYIIAGLYDNWTAEQVKSLMNSIDPVNK